MSTLIVPQPTSSWRSTRYPSFSEVVLFDNRAGGFCAVNPEWDSREIRLIEVAVELMARGTPLGIATSFDQHNVPLIAALRDAVDQAGLVEQLTIIQRQHLHTKGVLLKRGLLTGSMNLTYNGLELNDEMVVYDTRPKTIAEARLNFESYVGREALAMIRRESKEIVLPVRHSVAALGPEPNRDLESSRVVPSSTRRVNSLPQLRSAPHVDMGS